MLRFSLYEVIPGSHVDADFEDEPETRRWLLSTFLDDMYGQEDLYLAELAKAEAGGTGDIYNNYVHAYFFPDYAILEYLEDPELEDEAAQGPRNCTRLSLVETKQLILDWLAAKKRWYEPQAAKHSE